MSSDWRRGRTLDELREHLQAAGITAPLLDVTPVLHRARWKEIAAWLEQWKASGGAAIEAFAIVDDGFGMEQLAHRFVRTSPLNGLNEEAAARLHALLADPR